MITKQDTDRIIEALADKTLSFGCRVIHDPMKYSDGSGKEELTLVGKNMSIGFDHENIYPSAIVKILGHPIRIGNVLELSRSKNSIVEIKRGEHKGKTAHIVALIARLWKPFGYTKSLQEILAAAEWKYVCPDCKSLSHGCCLKGGGKASMKVLKGPAAELFELLDTFLPKEK